MVCLDFCERVVTCTMFVWQGWNDYQLQWDEADYGGIGVLRLPPEKVWKPDIVLFNKWVPVTLNDIRVNFYPSFLQVWNDYQLQWDEADYGGIGVLRLPPDKVWKPDIVLFNKWVKVTPITLMLLSDVLWKHDRLLFLPCRWMLDVIERFKRIFASVRERAFWTQRKTRACWKHYRRNCPSLNVYIRAILIFFSF